MYSSKFPRMNHRSAEPTLGGPGGRAGSVSHSIQKRHKLIQFQQQRRPKPYALEDMDIAKVKSKNKDINSFQQDVYYHYTLPSEIKLLNKKASQDRKLKQVLERNITDPHNQW